MLQQKKVASHLLGRPWRGIVGFTCAALIGMGHAAGSSVDRGGFVFVTGGA